MGKVSVTKSTGFIKFDELIGDIDRARLIIVGGRAAIGKTAFAISMAKNIAIDQQIPTAFFSLEMSLKLLSLRIVCNICQLDNRKVMNGQLSKKEANLFASKKRELNEYPLYIDDTPGLSIPEFDTKVRTLIDRQKVKVVIIDYLQLMHADKTYKNHKQESTNVLKRLRGLADDLNITIVVLSQLQRRKVRGWIKPTIYSLRVYVSFDKYADVVALIHRPEYYHILNSESKEQDKHGLAQIFIRKNCLGEKGYFLLKFDSGTSRFYDPY